MSDSPAAWKDRLRIVLVEPRNPLNIGAAARAMLNFGFRRLWLVAPWERAFRDAKSAMGAAAVLRSAQVVSDLPEALGGATLSVGTSALAGRSADIVQRPLRAAALALRSHLQTSEAALLFGSEKFGLSREHLSHCDWILTIPTNPGCPSMNLGQAAALCCYELACESRPVPELQTPVAVSAEERNRIVSLLLPVLGESGFLFPGSEESQTRKIRRWIGRLRLSPKDARMFQGMLRQIHWRLGRLTETESIDKS